METETEKTASTEMLFILIYPKTIAIQAANAQILEPFRTMNHRPFIRRLASFTHRLKIVMRFERQQKKKHINFTRINWVLQIIRLLLQSQRCEYFARNALPFDVAGHTHTHTHTGFILRNESNTFSDASRVLDTATM